MADARTTWKPRVAGWRASGLTADVYSARHGFAANSLRWWSSRLAREAASPPATVRFAQLVRSPATVGDTASRGAIVVEFLDARVRLTVDVGAERETLTHIIEVVLARTAR
jgi:transposase